jgi:preprotein translocase subunit SecA
MFEQVTESIGNFLGKIFGSQNERVLKRLWTIVNEQIVPLPPRFEAMSDADLRAMTDAFRARLAKGDSLDDILPEAFSAVREASRRTTGLRHFDVQLLGGIVLHRGMISEMATGEGKTLVATSAAYLNALTGEGVHVVTVNDYLARRDTQWMGPIYDFLGLTVGCIQHEQAFLFDRAWRDEPGEKMRRLRDEPTAEEWDRIGRELPPQTVMRRLAYRADITYGTNNEFGFDYLRDNMKVRAGDRVQRGHHYAIVDEVDNILIDEARTPLIISGPAEESTEKYYISDRVARQMIRGEEITDADGIKRITQDFLVKEKEHAVILSDDGIGKAERLVGVDSFYSGGNMEWPHHIEQALRAHHLYKRDRDYVVQNGEVIIVDEFTGRLMPGRRWSDGLHQAVESKEGLRIKEETQTYATITLQNYFKMYAKLAGMTGTAATEAAEFEKIYKLSVVVIPTNRFLRRDNYPDVVFGTESEKFDAIEEEIDRLHKTGRPILVGTTSIENSEKLSDRLRKRGIRHEVLNAKFHEREAHVVARAGEFASVTIATNMAGRGTDILLGRFADAKTEARRLCDWLREAHGLKVEPDGIPEGPPDAVLRALAERIDGVLAHRKEHDGSDPAVQRRAVQVYLEKGLAGLDAIAAATPPADPKAPAEAPLALDVADVLRTLHTYVHEGVPVLGGLHVLGTERHEARRIDNQLRGRSGRQGDPGSSQVFMSLDDELMRKFAPPWAIKWIKAELRPGEAIESKMVTKSIARAQKNVESHNFEIRKNLLEYDEVPNEQRKIIYTLRQKILEEREVRESLLDMAANGIYRGVDTYLPERVPETEWDLDGLATWCRQKLGLQADPALFRGKKPEDIAEYLIELYQKQIELREREMGPDVVKSMAKWVMLDRIDEKWKEHLYNMDQIRSSVGLRHYAQVDPKVEYKREARELFDTMMDAIREEVTELSLKVRPAPPPPAAVPTGPRLPVGSAQAAASMLDSMFARLGKRWRGTEVEHEVSSALDGAGSAPSRAPARVAAGGFGPDEFGLGPGSSADDDELPPGAPAPRPKPFVTTMPKVGRNDPCPCGSGKKYKKCHGALGG